MQRSAAVVMGLAGVLAGCGAPRPCGPDNAACLGGSEGATETEAGSNDGGNWLTPNKDVDILFVVDNSGSMGEDQAILANSIAPLIERLEAEDVDANYRIGITTTDNSNPWCPTGMTTPERGGLVLRSCKDQLGEYSFQDDSHARYCTDFCSLGTDDLQVLPTTTDTDPNPEPRPWLENIEGTSNLPAGIGMAEALTCLLPQGIRGCGFESPLESMHLALTRAEDPQDEQYGFMRSNAVLVVVIVTDEADCSYNEQYAEIFEQDGNREFWSDPTASFPTSAVCWNAGVTCTGDPSSYSACDPANKDVDGNVGVPDEQAVLHPMQRYFDLLDALEQQKQEFDSEQQVIVALIGGVDAQGQAVYADVSDTDPEFQNSFGIGPGCTVERNFEEPSQAVPPVRLRVLVDRYWEGGMFSICEGSYATAMATVAERIRQQL